jgi:valyl-tRNA synthetase
MKKELSKAFEASTFESGWYDFWLEKGYFTARPDSGKPPFCIVIPPPNVTGKLHMGHALNNTLHDVIVRWKRMQGFDVLWLPGTDHAGIATQMVVERELAKEGKNRHAMGREAFLEVMWAWKAQYKDNIKRQLQMLGCSCDWTRERFTLDEGLSKAVRKAFVTLYDEGLITRGWSIVNWCPRCQTALSDLEVEHMEVKGKLWHIRYPLQDGAGSIVVATTRPETMLGDTAVAVHPEDERYQALVGKMLVLPLMERPIPIIADEGVEKEFGTGAVKVTPAHDPNDFNFGKRHNLPSVLIMDDRGVLNDEAGPYQGMDRFEARRKVVADLEAKGLLVEIKDHLHNVGHCQRCRTMVEPTLSRQWFVKMEPLAAPAVQVVEDGRIQFIPDQWVKVYNEWLTNIHDWCISRQLWWGHRIPAWYCPCGATIVAETDPAACPKCGSRDLKQDEDVLDTWFSSGLWPFSTLGWPEPTEDLRRYYPTDLLITGFDILFFWVARMTMAGLKFRGEVPFRQVYFTGLVRDAQGDKMSKTKGNVIDPEQVCREFGPDAVRFTLAIHASYGRDIPLSYERMAGYKAFVNKLWNASRFILSNLDGPPPAMKPTLWPHRHIVSRLHAVLAEVDEALTLYRFDTAAHALYHFLWHEFCDWFIEIAKPHLRDEAAKAQTQSVLYHVLETCLRALHPFIPFITEEIWQNLETGGESLAVAAWPKADPSKRDPQAEAHFAAFEELVTRVRAFKVGSNLDKKAHLRLFLHLPAGREAFAAYFPLLKFMENCDAEAVPAVEALPAGVKDNFAGLTWCLKVPVEELTPEFLARVRKEMAKLGEEVKRADARLVNEAFTSKAKPEVIEEARRKREALLARLATLKETFGTGE